MTANKEIFYWQEDKSWSKFDEKLGVLVLTDKAPERAKKSYEAFIKWSKRRALA